MAADFTIKLGFRYPAIEHKLKDGNGNYVNLTGATVKLEMLNPVTKTAVFSTAATIVDNTTGHVRYQWAAADTDERGMFLAHWRVTFADSHEEAFPSDRFFTVEVL